MIDKGSTEVFLFFVGPMVLGLILYLFNDSASILFTTRPGQVAIVYALTMGLFAVLSNFWKPFGVILVVMTFVLCVLVMALMWGLVIHGIVMIWNFDTTYRWYHH